MKLTKRLLTDEELDKFLELRETKGDKQAAKYMAGLQDKLYTDIKETKTIIIHGNK